MELRESGLSFNGQHSYNDYGCWWIEDGGHPVSPASARPRYAIAGAGGRTIPVGPSISEAMELSGTLVMEAEPENQVQAQIRIREIQKWLAGSGKLIFDYEPDKYYMATVEELTGWSLKNWFGGELSVTWRLEPYAYALQRVTATGSLASASTGYACTLTIEIPGIRDVPAAIELSGVTYHSCSVDVNGETQCEWANSTSLGSGVRLYSEWPGLTGDESNYPVTGSGAWTQAPGMIVLKPGTNTVTVTADATGSVTVYARPRW